MAAEEVDIGDVRNRGLLIAERWGGRMIGNHEWGENVER
jgi:hypothetical protein